MFRQFDGQAASLLSGPIRAKNELKRSHAESRTKDRGVRAGRKDCEGAHRKLGSCLVEGARALLGNWRAGESGRPAT